LFAGELLERPVLLGFYASSDTRDGRGALRLIIGVIVAVLLRKGHWHEKRFQVRTAEQERPASIHLQSWQLAFSDVKANGAPALAQEVGSFLEREMLAGICAGACDLGHRVIAHTGLGHELIPFDIF
jgi:hypothetical protein